MRSLTMACAMGSCLFSAGQTFNVRHDLLSSINNSGAAWSVETTSDGNFAVFSNGNYSDSVFFSSVVRCLVLSSSGELTSEVIVPDFVHATYPGWSNGSHQRSDGGFVVGGSNFRTDSLDNWIQRPVLFFFDGNGIYEQQIPLGPDNEEWIGRQAKQTSDGGYVICGETTVDGTHTDAFVIKTDPEGNEQWTQTYGGPWNDYFVAVDQWSNSRYYSSGIRRISPSNMEFWVVALNDTGGIVWEKIWGGFFPESNANVSVAQNGDVLVAGKWGYNGFAIGRRYLARLDPEDGSFIWQREYGPQASDIALQMVKEIAPSMDLISAGPMSLGSAGYRGTLLRTTSAGDSLWMRSYHYEDTLVELGGGFFRDVTPTSDGGFIAVGTAMPVSGIYSQDVWVVKVDEHGCLEPGCHIITGMETQITNMRDVLHVWPNPVQLSSPINVELRLPEHFIAEGQLRITLTSSDGRLVHEAQISKKDISRTHSLTLSLSHPFPGLYHLHLSDATRWISGAKLVVE